jgi:hypothetical protein
MESLKIRCIFITVFIGFLLIFYSDVILAQSISEKEVRQAKKEQGLVGRYFQDSASKKWFLEDREGDTYKFDENIRKWVKLGEPPAPTLATGRKGDAMGAPSENIIRDKYYVAVKTLKLFQQPERGAREVGTLEFRTKVEKLAENEDGWMQVRQRETNLTGWVYKPRWNLEKYQLERPVGRGKKKGPTHKEEPKEPKPEAKPEPM